MSSPWNIGNKGVSTGSTRAIAVTVGDMIIAFAASSANCTFSDNVNGAYTTGIQYTAGRCRLCVGAVIATTTATVTITATGGTVDQVHAFSVRNRWGFTASVLTPVATASGATDSNTVNITTPSTNCLIVGIADASTANITGSGYTEIGNAVSGFRIETEFSAALSAASSITVNTTGGSPARGIAAVAYNVTQPTQTAPTFFGVATAPADNSSQAGPGALSITPPSSMLAGDLVFVFAQMTKATQPNVLVTNAGGQRWSFTGDKISTGSNKVTGRGFWCTFNGTWSADPTWTDATSGTGAMSLQMLVFRPNNASVYNNWLPETFPKAVVYAAPSTPFTVTRAGEFSSRPATVTIAAFQSENSVTTWGTLSGSGWSQSGLGSQYRNTSGAGHSGAYAYRLSSVCEPSGSVSLNQATGGGDAGTTNIFSFANVAEIRGGSGAISGTPVQTGADISTSSGQTFGLTFGSPITAGNAVICSVSFEGTLGSIANGAIAWLEDVYDDKGNEYRCIHAVGDAPFTQHLMVLYAVNVRNAPTKITALLGGNVGAANPFGIDFMEVSGLLTLGDRNGVNQTNAVSTSVDPGPMTPSRDGAFIYECARNVGALVSLPYWTFTGWGATKRQEVGGGGTLAARASASLLQTTAATVNCTAVQTSSNAANVVCAAFIPAGVAPRSLIVRQAVNRASTF